MVLLTMTTVFFASLITADIRTGLRVSVEADGGGGLGVRPGGQVVGSVDGVIVIGPGSSLTL